MVTFQRRRPAEQCEIRVQISGGVSFVMGDLATQVDSATRRDREIDQSGNTVTVHLSDREWTRLPTLMLESVREQYVHDLLMSTDKGSVQAEADAQTRLSGQVYARSLSGGNAQIGIEAEVAEGEDNIRNKVLKSVQGVGIRVLGTTKVRDQEWLFFPENNDSNTFDLDSYNVLMNNLRDQITFNDTRLVCRTV